MFRSVPTLLLVYVFLFALPGLGLNLPIAGKLIVPIILINAAVIAEIVRAGIAALDRGQREAAAAVGLTRAQTMRLVLLPFDSVSFFCGLTGVRPRDFLLGTMLGGGCYIVGITLLGGSASVDLTGQLSIGGVSLSRRVWVLVLSGCSFALGLLLAWRLRGMYRDENEEAA